MRERGALERWEAAVAVAVAKWRYIPKLAVTNVPSQISPVHLGDRPALIVVLFQVFIEHIGLLEVLQFNLHPHRQLEHFLQVARTLVSVPFLIAAAS